MRNTGVDEEQISIDEKMNLDRCMVCKEELAGRSEKLSAY